jgi:hypothetical protein
MIDDRYRRWFGMGYGALVGLVFGLVSQGINYAVLPGINFHQPPFGPVINAIGCVLIGAALGLLCAWYQVSIGGAMLASVLGALIVMVATFLSSLNDPTPLAGRVLIIIFLFLPIFGAMVPLNYILGWVASHEAEEKANRRVTAARVLVPLGVLVVVGLVALAYLYNPSARRLLTRTDEMIQAGLQARDAAALPEPLSKIDGSPFLGNATPDYTLEWDNNDLNRFSIPYPASGQENMSVVIARFDSGWRMVCLFMPVQDRTRCRGYDLDDPIFGGGS